VIVHLMLARYKLSHTMFFPFPKMFSIPFHSISRGKRKREGKSIKSQKK